jgi:hypothetical protein
MRREMDSGLKESVQASRKRRPGLGIGVCFGSRLEKRL